MAFVVSIFDKNKVKDNVLAKIYVSDFDLPRFRMLFKTKEGKLALFSKIAERGPLSSCNFPMDAECTNFNDFDFACVNENEYDWLNESDFDDDDGEIKLYTGIYRWSPR